MRDPSIPLRRIRINGEGVSAIASVIEFYVICEGEQRVLVSPHGHVYSMAVGTIDEVRECKAHPDWLVGTYTLARNGKRDDMRNMLRRQMGTDIAHHLKQLKALA